MLNALLADVKLAAAQTQASVADGVRRAVLAAAGGTVLLVGLGFLTTALWILLEREWSSLVAATSIAGIYLVVGFILLMMSGRRRRRVVVAAPLAAAAAVPPPAGTRVPPAGPFASPISPDASVVPPLVSAFLFGLGAARTAGMARPKRRRRRRREYYPEDDW